VSNFVFLSLPENYRLVDALSDGVNQLWWRTTRLQERIAVGDQVFLWQGRGHQPEMRGVHAIAEVVERPRKLSPNEFDDYWVTDAEKAINDDHTHLRIVERAVRGRHLRQNVILNSPVLREKGVFNGAMGANFRVSASFAAPFALE